ncbi:MAG: branched-chain amino acid transporter substrate-binding protein [Candidatus Nomurabacteria bacterium]|nr:branched-chain amino acid transporter substrate-binding protein [Candidatus Nomurabacteria bacterium]
MKKPIVGVLVLTLIVLVVWLFVEERKSSQFSESIKIGYVVPLTGDAATYGEPMKNAASLAVEEINNSGGVNGRKLEVIYEDSKCSGKDALTATQKLISIDKVQVLDGFTCAEDLLNSASLIEKNKIITLSPGALGPGVSAAGDYIFQTNPSATVATKKLTSLIFKNHTNVIVVSENTGFAIDIRDFFSKEFESLGGKVTLSETYNPNTKDFRAILQKIKKENPSAIFINPQTEITGGLFIKQARELGITADLFSLDTLSGPTTREISGDASEGLTLVTVPDLDTQNQKANEFLKKYKEKYGDPVFPLYLASAYDSINIIAQAIQIAGDDSQKIKDYLYKMSDYHGAVGTYHFDKNGDIEGIDFVVKKMVSGKLINIK